MKRTTIYLAKETHQKIKEYAFKNNLTMAEVIRMALDTSMILVDIGEKAIVRTTQKTTERVKIEEPVKTTPLARKRGELDPGDYF